MKWRSSIFTTFYILAAVVMSVMFLAVVITTIFTRERIEHRFVDLYYQQQAVTAKQTADGLQVQVNAVQDKLNYLAQLKNVQTPSAEQCGSQLDNVLKTLGLNLVNLSRVDAKGIFTCTLNTKLIGTTGEQYAAAISDITKDSRHQPVMSRMIKPAGSNSYVISVYVPIYDSNSRFLGALGGDIGLNKLADNYFKTIHIGKTGYVTVIDDNGDIIYSQTREYIGRNRYEPELRKRTANNPRLNQAYESVRKGGDSKQLEFTVNGEGRFATITSMEVMPGRRWIVYGIVPASEIESSATNLGISRTLSTMFAIFGGVVLAGWALLLWFLRERIFVPLRHLNKVTEKIKAGDQTVRVRHIRRDELGTLGKSFNTMLDKLKDYHSDLEQEVSDKTAQLAKTLRDAEAKNSELERTQKAVINILDDLNNEKASVEAQKAKNDSLLNGIGEGLIMINKQGVIERVNGSAEQLLGFTEKEMIGKPYHRTLKAFDETGNPIPVKLRPVTQTLMGHSIITTDILYRRKDGFMLPVKLTVAPVLINGKLIGAIEVFRDFTKEKEVDKAKTEFVSLASHQLRTPLSTINWYAEMLLAGDAGKLSAEQIKYIEEIAHGNKRMTELVGALLNVSRVDLGTFSVDPHPTDLKKLAQEIVKDLEPRIFSRKIDFQEQYQENLPKINVDAKLMRMVIENLASNAVKYTPESGTVVLSLMRVNGSVEVTIKDTGYGIPAAQQNKIFSKLFRADNVKVQDTEGTGLGLYLVKSIVDYAGGKIWFESTEDKGTTFHVSLPIKGMRQKTGSKRLE
jgi:PAS domain S-box-containing protein